MIQSKRLWTSVLALSVGCLWQTSLVAQAPEEAAEGDAGGRLMRDPAAEEAYTQGVAALQEEKYKEAVAAFNIALRADGTYTEAYIGKGDALKALEDYQSAGTAYSRAIELDPNLPQAFNGRGECFLELRQIDLASNDFSNALELDPNNAEVLSNMGHILVNYAQDPASAIRRLDDALALNDQDARAHRDRGYAHALLREFDKAEADLQRAVEIDPTDHENFAIMANIYLFQENFPSAIGALGSAIESYKPEQRGEPDQYISGYLARADAWLKIGEKEADPAKAESAFESAIADCDAVIAVFEDRFPESGRAYFRKGRAQRMLERYSDAVDSLTRAIQTVPGGQDVEYMADAYMYRGICWYYIGSHNLARGDFDQASSTGNGYQDPRIFLWIGFTHHQQGEYREAIESYSEAIAKAPGFALAHINRGRAYMDLGEYNRAIESFNDAIRAEPNVGEHYYRVGFAYMRLDEHQKAVDFLNLAIRKENPQPKMFRLMATALRELGRDELAEEYERRAGEPQQPATGG